MKKARFVIALAGLVIWVILSSHPCLAEVRELTDGQMESISGKAGILISIDTIGSDKGGESITDRVYDTGFIFISGYLDKVDYAMYREVKAIYSNTITGNMLMNTLLENIIKSVSSFNIDSIALDLTLPHTDGVDLGSMDIKGVNINSTVNISD